MVKKKGIMIRKRFTAGIFVLLFSVVSVSSIIYAAAASANQVDGVVYWDKNNNGMQDGTEPGVPGIAVSYGFGAGQKVAITDVNGVYNLSALTGTGAVTVHAGWLRSACDSLNCAAGIAGGNDFPVANQLITKSGVSGANGATMNVGLVPAWGGTYPIPTTNPGSAQDIATRFTYASGCGTDATRLCQPGSSAVMYVAFMNQGTQALANPEFVVELPVGHTVVDNSWTDPANTLNVAYPGLSTVTVLEPFSSRGHGKYRLNGTLAPGANTSIAFTMLVGSGALPSSSPYPTANPYSKQGTVRITGIGQAQDIDSSLCETNANDWRFGSCAISRVGIHEKLQPLDHTDIAGWNVSGVAASAAAYDVAATVQLGASQSSEVRAGDAVQYIVQLTNAGAGEALVRNIPISVAVPSGMQFVPADNPGWSLIGLNATTTMTAQMLPGQAYDLPLSLRVADTTTSAANGTAALLVTASIANYQSAVPGGSGYLAAVVDTNGANNTAARAITIAPPAGDTTAPSVPTGLSATNITYTQATVSWTASTDTSGVSGYYVKRNGTIVATVSTTNFTDTGLTGGTTYGYTVAAFDSSSNISADSTPLTVQTPASPTEYVTNKSVESNLTGWSDLWNPASTILTRSTEAAHNGTYAIKVTSKSATSTSGGFVNQTSSLRWVKNTVLNKQYTAKAWVKGSVSGMRFCVRLTEYAGSTNKGFTESCQTFNDTNWHEVTNVYPAKASGSSLATSVYTSSINTSKYFYADDFSLTAPQ